MEQDAFLRTFCSLVFNVELLSVISIYQVEHRVLDRLMVDVLEHDPCKLPFSFFSFSKRQFSCQSRTDCTRILVRK